jgi:predicted polyphosphate/ATP-dependent NAD kinase
MSSAPSFTFGLLVNPLAGIGGPAGLKGSDHADTASIASERGVLPKASLRLIAVLEGLKALLDSGVISSIKFITASGQMGEDSFESYENSFSVETVYQSPMMTCAEDTRNATKSIIEHSIDMLLFVGGDGTARDVYEVLGSEQSVLGIPAGVKMHSGVFAVTPRAVVSVIESMAQRKLVAAKMAEVRDIDETAFLQGKVKTRYYGEMLIPDDQLLVQSVKCSGMLDDELMLEELCAFMSEELETETLYVLGSGGTLRALKERVGIEEPTLLGVDVCYVSDAGVASVVALDVHESQLYELMQGYSACKIVLSVIGGQGIVLGRGNQQISPRVIQQAGIENLQFISTQEKIKALNGRALRVDSGSDELDKALSGIHKIICGYDDAILYEISYLA